MKRIVLSLIAVLLMSSPAFAMIRSTQDTPLYEKKFGDAYKIGTVTPDDDVVLLSSEPVAIKKEQYYFVKALGQKGYIRVDDLEYVSDNVMKKITEALDRIDELEARVAELEALEAQTEEPEATHDLPIAQETELPQEATLQESITLTPGTWIVGEDLPAGKYNATCISGVGRITFYKDYETRMGKSYDYFEDYTMASESYLDSVSSFGEAFTSMYIVTASNIRLSDGNCVYIDSITVNLEYIG